MSKDDSCKTFFSPGAIFFADTVHRPNFMTYTSHIHYYAYGVIFSLVFLLHMYCKISFKNKRSKHDTIVVQIHCTSIQKNSPPFHAEERSVNFLRRRESFN